MSDHYTQIAADYHSSLFYASDSELEAWQFANFRSLLPRYNADYTPTLLDLGSGSCRLSDFLIHSYTNNAIATCVDKSQHMLNLSPQNAQITRVCANMHDYIKTANCNKFDAILLKEVIHFIDPDTLQSFFNDCKAILHNHGIIVICTRPQQPVEYPLFPQALTVWQNTQPDHKIYLCELQQAGFKVKYKIAQLPVSIPLDVWVEFIRKRIWSIFSRRFFSDLELEHGIAQLYTLYGPAGVVSFNETQVYITAKHE